MARILVVDDEATIRDLLRDLLTLEGHDVRTAEDGRSAVRLVAAQPVDLIITDIFMPAQEGLETIMQLRRDHPDVPIVAMSGGGSTGQLDYLRDALNLGAVGGLSKPFSTADVLGAVSDALARRGT
jgi:CheY-like chemotaxis protein